MWSPVRNGMAWRLYEACALWLRVRAGDAHLSRRAGRPIGPIPWVALIVGTAASLAANVAVGGADLIGKALAGWPAVSMLVSIKLLLSLIDTTRVDRWATVPDDQRTSAAVPDVPGTVRQIGRAGTAPAGSIPGGRADYRAPSTTAPADSPATPTAGIPGQPARGRFGAPDDPAAASLDIRTVAHLIPAARAARATLTHEGRSLSRDNLAGAMRDDGHGVSNLHASLLVKIPKTQ